MAQQWYFSRTGQQEGPVTKEALAAMARAGQLQPMHLVWSPGMANWQAAGDVEEAVNGVLEAVAQAQAAAAAAGTEDGMRALLEAMQLNNPTATESDASDYLHAEDDAT